MGLWEHNMGDMELQKPGERRPVLWVTAIGSLAVALAIFVFLGYYFEWEWTGFPPKKLFDWVQILVIPVAVAAGTFTLNRAAKRRDDKDQKKQREREEAIQEQHAQDTALEAYLEQ